MKNGRRKIKGLIWELETLELNESWVFPTETGSKREAAIAAHVCLFIFLDSTGEKKINIVNRPEAWKKKILSLILLPCHPALFCHQDKKNICCAYILWADIFGLSVFSTDMSVLYILKMSSCQKPAAFCCCCNKKMLPLRDFLWGFTFLVFILQTQDGSKRVVWYIWVGAASRSLRPSLFISKQKPFAGYFGGFVGKCLFIVD